MSEESFLSKMGPDDAAVVDGLLGSRAEGEARWDRHHDHDPAPAQDALEAIDWDNPAVRAAVAARLHDSEDRRSPGADYLMRVYGTSMQSVKESLQTAEQVLITVLADPRVRGLTRNQIQMACPEVRRATTRVRRAMEGDPALR